MPPLVQMGPKRATRMRLRTCGHLIGSAGDDQLAALVTAFRTEINDPVRTLNDVEVMFDHQNGMACVD